MAKENKKALQHLESLGFTLEHGNGSRIKIYPPDKTKPFYSFHDSHGGFHPLRRFAKKNWNIELTEC